MLAQHYFRVPLDRQIWENENEQAHHAAASPSASSTSTASSSSSSGTIPITTNGLTNGSSATVNGKKPAGHQTSVTSHVSIREDVQDDELMHLWYVSTPFEVVRVYDGPEDDDENGLAERPRPLVAVDFGHAVWIEYLDGEGDDDDLDEESGDGQTADNSDPVVVDSLGESSTSETGPTPSSGAGIPSTNGIERMDLGGSSPSKRLPAETESETDGSPPTPEMDPKRLRFVTFPPFEKSWDTVVPSYQPRREKAKAEAEAEAAGLPPPDPPMMLFNCRRTVGGLPPGVVHTLPTPPELHLSDVETINIDQSQGAVILSDKNGKIWILCYE